MADARGVRRRSSKPERWWWQAEPEPTAEPSSAALARHRAVQEQLLRFDQNAWLAKHAKQRRFQFSAAQKRMLRQWFDALDADGSGKISVEELEDPMLSIGIVNDTREIREIVCKLDKDANGQIDFQEFVDFLTPHARRNKARSPEKHELMFQQLTQKMEHQSSGFLEINTQLSMERRRFILDSITKFPAQSIQEDLAELKRSKASKSTASSVASLGSAATTVPSTFDSTFAEPTSPSKSRHKKAVSRRTKLAALAVRHQEEMRFQALEQVFLRNSALKRLQALPASLQGTPVASRRTQRRMQMLSPLPASEKPSETSDKAVGKTNDVLRGSDSRESVEAANRRATAKLLEKSGMSTYTRAPATPTQSASMPNLPPHDNGSG